MSQGCYHLPSKNLLIKSITTTSIYIFLGQFKYLNSFVFKYPIYLYLSIIPTERESFHVTDFCFVLTSACDCVSMCVCISVCVSMCMSKSVGVCVFKWVCVCVLVCVCVYECISMPSNLPLSLRRNVIFLLPPAE